MRDPGWGVILLFCQWEKPKEDAINFAGEIDSSMPEYCSGNRWLAGEKARSVKGVDAIKAMCPVMHSCQLVLVEMEWISALGLMEAEIWAVLHAENINRGGEWIDLAAGERSANQSVVPAMWPLSHPGRR